MFTVDVKQQINNKSSAKVVADFEIISQEGSLGNSTKIAQTVLRHWTRWPPELKIEKPSNDFSSLASAWIMK